MKIKILLLAVLLTVLSSCSGKSSVAQVSEPHSMEDLSEARLVTILGSLQDVEISRRYPDYKNLNLNSPAELLAAVESGNADYLILDSASFIGIDLPARGLKYYFSLPMGGDIAFGFRYDEKSLVDTYNSFLSGLKESGIFQEIEDRWTKGDIESAEMPDIPIPDSGDPLMVGVSNAFPFEFVQNGEWSGFEVEIIKRFAAHLGRPVRFVNYDFNAITAALMTDKIDLICSDMFVTEERAKQVLFSDPHFYSGTVCIGRDLNRGSVPAVSLEELNGHSIGVLTGSSMEVYAKENFNKSEIFRADGIESLVRSLETDQVEAILVMDKLSVEMLGGHSDFVVIDKVLYSDSISALFSPNGARLWKDFNDLLSSLRASGEYERMVQRWNNDGVNAEMPEFIMPGGINPLKVGIQTGTSAFCFEKDGRYCGFSVELACLFAKAVGRPVEFVDAPFSNLLANLESGKLDMICSSGTVTKERARSFLFSDKLFDINIKAVTKKAQRGGETSFFKDIRESFRVNLIVEDRWKMILQGLWETLVISFFSILLGTVIGAGLCGMRLSGVKALDATARFVIEIVRGVPMLVFLMIMFYIVFASSGLAGRWVAVIAFAINFGAYTSEMFRTGIESIDKGQTEAGLAMGFSPASTFANFILPQAVKKIVPVYKGEAISLIKNTSIVGYIAITDLTRVSDLIRSRTFDAFFPLIIVSIIYFILAWLLGRLLDRLSEKI
ncbi:MAG: ABC transporter permease subunit [Bacteroidales bacterium]|nr:ABC transporter permease subunit [Bacteroidales bacterium]